MKHTPRLWEIGRATEIPMWRVEIKCGSHVVAAAYGSTIDEAEVNARLIAAAPDLLAACEAAHDWVTQFCEHAPIVFGGETDLAEQLLAALAKAVDYS